MNACICHRSICQRGVCQAPCDLRAFRHMSIIPVTLFYSAFVSWAWSVYSVTPYSFMAAYGWSRTMVVVLTNYNIVTVACTLPMCYLIYRLGVKYGTIICTAVVGVGLFIRCFDMNNLAYTVIANVGLVLLACGTSVSSFTVPYAVCAKYFEPRWHSPLLLSIFIASHFGRMASFFGLPLIIEDPMDGVNQTVENISAIRHDAVDAMVISSVLAAACILGFFWAFHSVEGSDTEFHAGLSEIKVALGALCRKVDFWTFGLTAAWLACFFSALIPTWFPLVAVKNFGLSQRESGVVAGISILMATAVGTLLELLFARGSTKIGKALIGVTFLFGAAGGAWLLFFAYGHRGLPIATNDLMVQLALSLSLLQCGFASSLGVFVSQLCIKCEPVPHEATTAMMSMLFYVFCGLAMHLAEVTTIPLTWAVWLSCLSTLPCVFLLFFIEFEDPRRQRLDFEPL